MQTGGCTHRGRGCGVALRPSRLEGRSELAIRLPPDAWIDRQVVREELRASHAAYELALEQSLRMHARPYVAR